MGVVTECFFVFLFLVRTRLVPCLVEDDTIVVACPLPGGALGGG